MWDGEGRDRIGDEAPVLVEWVKSYHSAGWGDLEEKLRDDHSNGSCGSVGWVVEDSEEWLGITFGWTGGDWIDGVLRIPRVAVKSVERLVVASSLGEDAEV